MTGKRGKFRFSQYLVPASWIERCQLRSILVRLQRAKANERGVHLDAQEVKLLLDIQGVRDEITTHKRELLREPPPICYTPITGPAPHNALLNRCGLDSWRGELRFVCCTKCWCLKSSAGAEL